MKRFALVSALFLFAFSVKAQNDSQDQKSYALLDLGFNAKMLNLAVGNPLLVPKEEEVVKKSPRSLSDILGKSKSSSKKASAAEYHLVAGCFSNFKNAELKSEIRSLNPILRLAIGSLVMVDKEAVITDTNRTHCNSIL